MNEPAYGEAFDFAVPSWRALALIAFGAILLFVGFGSVAIFDRVATVRGVVAPDGGVSRLIAPQPGIVTQVLTRSGALLTRGDPVLRIGAAERLPDGAGASTTMLDTFRRQQRSARARRDAERRRIDLERRRLRQQEAELLTGLRSVRQQANLQRRRVASNEQRWRALGPLRDRGYVSDFAYQQQEETVLSLRQQLTALVQRDEETRHQLEAARLRRFELAAEGGRIEAESASSFLDLERGATTAQVAAEVTLAASMTGRVASLRAETGMTVSSGEPLAVIEPERSNLEALLFVPPGAAGSLERGQEVALRYDAFPYQRYGIGRGVVHDIASAATIEQPGQAPSYRVRVRLLNAGRFALRTDMTLAAVVILERRSLLDWLLAPLRQYWWQSR